MEWVVSVDSSIVRPHQHAAGARGGLAATAPTPTQGQLGRSRGGLTTKIQLSVDRRGRPLSILLTPGQAGWNPFANDDYWDDGWCNFNSGFPAPRPKIPPPPTHTAADDVPGKPAPFTSDTSITHIQLNKRIGDAYADDIATFELGGAMREATFSIPGRKRGRRTDIGAGPGPTGALKATEVKVGFVENRSRIRREVSADDALLRSGRRSGGSLFCRKQDQAGEGPDNYSDSPK